MERDLYEILGVDKTASQDEIKRVYKKLARQYHPDLNPGDATAEEKFKEVSAAYDVLSDVERRAAYDEFGHDATRVGFDPEKARAHQRWQEQAAAARSHGGARGFDDLSDLFGGAFGGRVRDFRTAPRRGVDIEAELTVSFLDAAHGAQRDISLSDPATGERSDIRLTIPEGIADGQRIRLRGKGAPGLRGGPPGDLYVTIRVSAHPLFRRDGKDLELELPITVKEAMLGAKVPVPTLDGRVMVTVPAASQTGRKLRLRGKGVTGGDLYAVLEVVVPTRSTEAAEAALDTLEALYEGDVRQALWEAP